MGSAVWQTIGVAEAKLGAWLAEAKAAITGLSTKVGTVVAQEKVLEPEIVTGVELVFADLEALVPFLEAATAGEGVNWPADSAAYQALLKLVADAKAVAPQVDAALADLKGLETV